MFTVPYVENVRRERYAGNDRHRSDQRDPVHYAVYAELPGGTYSPAELFISTPEF